MACASRYLGMLDGNGANERSKALSHVSSYPNPTIDQSQESSPFTDYRNVDLHVASLRLTRRSTGSRDESTTVGIFYLFVDNLLYE